MDEVTALIVFCEGPHDVAFCRLVFKYCFGIEKVDWKFSEYPAPLNQLFKTSMEKHAAQDMSLDMAHKFFLPNRTLYSEDSKRLVLLFNTGGKTKVDNPKQFLTDFLPLLDQATVFPDDASKVISETKYLFVYDSDCQSLQIIVQSCKDSFSDIAGTNFLTGDFSPKDGNSLAATADNKAVYIWCDKTSGKGTLEDILLPLFRLKNEDLLSKAEQFADDCFTWEVEHPEEARKYAERAKRHKAIISSAGQGEKPGRPMSAIINDNVLGTSQSFLGNADVKQFAKFVSDFSQLEQVQHG